MVIENLDIGIDSQDIVSYEWTAMLTEFKLSINEYLADLSYSPVHSLVDIISFNKAHPIEASIRKKLILASISSVLFYIQTV